MPVVHVRSLAVDAALAGSALPLVATRVAEAVPCAVDDVWGALHPAAPHRVFAGGELLG